jgi:hypothetical protein
MSKEPIAALTAFCVNNPELDQLEEMLSEFNFFEAAGLTRQEIRHSRFLAFLLDPKGAHGLGDLFFKRLLQSAVGKRRRGETGVTALELELMDLRDVQVACEVDNIDIFLQSASNQFAVIIENKVGSQEHSDQLSRCLKAAKAMDPGWRILPLFLSPNRAKPSHKKYVAVSYEDVATNLQKLIDSRLDSLGPGVALALTHYERLLRRHVVSDPKLTELCKQIVSEHRKALEVLMEHMDTPRSVARSFVDGMFEGAKWTRMGMYRYPPNWSKVVPDGTDGNRVVAFWVDYKPSALSIVIEILPGPEAVRKKLLRAAVVNRSAAEGSVFRPSRTTLGRKYNRILRHQIASSSLPSGSDIEVWKREVQKGFERFCTETLPTARKVLEEAASAL